MRRLLLAALAAVLVAPASASASDPIMALGDVSAGMRCTALTVVHGTTITSFDVEVLEVIDRLRPESARILVRVSGPAIDATGIGPGFSGSPILCADAAGVARNIGAISAGIGEYGGAVGIATPIETILAEPIQPPSAAPRAAARSPLVGSRPLVTPLTLSGLSPPIAAMFSSAARRAGRTLLTSVAAPRSTGHEPQPLVPGAAVAVGETSGDVELGAIGTVAYADGSDVWLFGHSLDGAGRRSLFLQDAYIHAVVNNPVGAAELSTYKLGAAGNDLGTVTSDGLNALGGRLGALPPRFPVKVVAHDLDTGRTRTLTTLVADEGDVGRPAGPSALGVAGAGAVAEAAASVLRGAPARQTGEMCVRITLRELRSPLHFCEHYAIDGGSPNPLAGVAAADFAQASDLVDGYQFGTLHPTQVEVVLRLRRGLRQAYLLDATGPSRVKRGQQVELRLRLRRTATGVRFTRTIRLRIPRDLGTGGRTIKLAGIDADAGSDPNEEDSLSFIFDPDAGDKPPPQTVKEVRDAVKELERYDGVTAMIGGREIRAYRDPDLRISGDARVAVQVRR
ncbi:MAG TPA: hypothetical protein VGO80_03430 [Solirubrobacteraceae bacterium]|jgi:hypothetical protein|nr:hypothetical protein [Solirubrobacteraceae bacterium]